MFTTRKNAAIFAAIGSATVFANNPLAADQTSGQSTATSQAMAAALEAL